MAGATGSSTGARVVFFGSHKRPSYVVERYQVPKKEKMLDGEILIKVLMSTICPLDLNYIDGREEVITPCILGHEGIGEVMISCRKTNGVSVVQPGDRVIFSMCIKCGSCCTCETNIQECCSKNMELSDMPLKDGCPLNGTYTTHIVLSSRTHIVCVPPNVPNSVACPANCALALMVHALSFVTSDQKKCSVAVIQGANLIGLYGCALLHEEGFQRIYCHDVAPRRLEMVEKFHGIPVLVNNENCNSEPGYGAADVVIDVCGEWDVVRHGLNMLRFGGIYLFVATSHDEHLYSAAVDTVIKKNLTVKGIQGYKAAHLQDAVNFLSRTVDRYPYDALVSPPHSIQDFHSAVALARSKLFYRTAIWPQSLLTV